MEEGAARIAAAAVTGDDVNEPVGWRNFQCNCRFDPSAVYFATAAFVAAAVVSAAVVLATTFSTTAASLPTAAAVGTT